MNSLVDAAYRHVPSLDQILIPTAVTRLRNQLLEAEYYQLAVEVKHREKMAIVPFKNDTGGRASIFIFNIILVD